MYMRVMNPQTKIETTGWPQLTQKNGCVSSILSTLLNHQSVLSLFLDCCSGLLYKWILFGW